MPALKLPSESPVLGSKSRGTSALMKIDSGPKSESPMRKNTPPKPGIINPPMRPA